MFPWREYNENDLIIEFKKLQALKNMDLSEFHLSSNIGKICSNYFFQYVRMNTRTNRRCLSCVEYWKNDINKIMKYYDSHPINDLFGTIVFLNKSPSQFSIITSCWIYKFFNVNTVFDPFSGWGDRCIASMSMNVDYTGCDSNEKLEYCYHKMIDLYKRHSNSNVKIYITKCELMIQELNDSHFDMLFSSPPFFHNHRLTEIYDNAEIDEKKFIEKCLVPIMDYGFSHCNYICLNLPEEMYNILTKKVKPANIIINFGKGRSYDIKNIIHNNLLYCWH